MSHFDFDYFFTQNHSLSTDSYDFPSDSFNKKKYIKGGAAKNKDINKPDGGFPPIYLCKQVKDEKINISDNKKREYETHKTSVSIKSILEKRRDITPFIQT